MSTNSGSLTAAIEALPTPNPDALLFRVQEVLVASGTFERRRGQDTADAPLATALLGVAGVEMVLITPRFVTVEKAPDQDWAYLEPQVRKTLADFLESGDLAVFESTLAAVEASSEVEARILTLLDEEIRPAIAQDGGDLTYLGFEDGIVKLRLIGSCGTCPSSVTTLKAGIERLLMEEIPEVREVINVGA